MLRCLLLFCVTISALGCGYEPLGLADNQPQLGDARIDRTVVLYGENRFEVGEYTDDGFREDCRLTSELQGWVEESNEADGCPSCSEVYAVTVLETEVEYFTNRIDQQESDCNFGLAGGFGIGFAPIESFPIDFSESFYEWLGDHEPDEGDGTAVSYMLTNWSPIGSSDWTPRLGLFDSADPLGTFDREYFVKSYYYYSTDHLETQSGRQFGAVRWKMDLRFKDQ
ncbi:MAG: hypothetical protein CMP23_09205 [Rickettsiales bacterium]|nr:hypothetical protein [Rickettsiales bacterium]|tara:strand:+ start:304 stop:978 length:675 start_codon:yes stop_codon:yes gene_type:complete